MGGDLVHLGEFRAGAGETDLQAFGFAEPAVRFGFGDAGEQVVADLDEPTAPTPRTQSAPRTSPRWTSCPNLS